MQSRVSVAEASGRHPEGVTPVPTARARGGARVNAKARTRAQEVQNRYFLPSRVITAGACPCQLVLGVLSCKGLPRTAHLLGPAIAAAAVFGPRGDLATSALFEGVMLALVVLAVLETHSSAFPAELSGMTGAQLQAGLQNESHASRHRCHYHAAPKESLLLELVLEARSRTVLARSTPKRGGGKRCQR